MKQLMQTILETRETLSDVPDDKKLVLVDSLVQLTQRLMGDLAKLGDIPENYLTVLEPSITEQIDAAEKRTERAADVILGATEKIMTSLPGVQGPIRQEIQNQVNAIFEASNFQDLVSQHLNEIKLRVELLTRDMRFLNDSMAGIAAGGGTNRAREPRRSDAHLLNGPSTKV